MTQAARDEREREIAPYDMTLTGGPDGPALAPEADPTDLTDPTYYTRDQLGPGPEDVQWTPIVDPAEIAAIQGAVAQGIDPPTRCGWTSRQPRLAPVTRPRLAPAIRSQPRQRRGQPYTPGSRPARLWARGSCTR